MIGLDLTVYEQFDFIEIKLPESPITSNDMVGLKLPALIQFNQGIVISGRAPIWLYTYLAHLCHPAKWVATHDPRLGAVVVASHDPNVRVGQIIEIA